ncbi:MAG: phosphotransacetylase family protein [Peptococcaceae bacterium]|nr:phosphotransacetylase family protein [Peptococcaceae bacterium]
MKSLFIMGTPASGKTAVCVGLALKLQQLGHRVAYFKPVGSVTGALRNEDEDGVLMKSVLKIEHPLEDIVPFTAGPTYLSGGRHCPSLEAVMASYRRVSEGADIVIVGGAAFPHIMGCAGLDSVTLAREFKSTVIFLIHIQNDFSMDNAIFVNNYLECRGIPIAGNIFNNVSRLLLAKTEGVYQPLLEEKGYRSLGIIPHRPEIASPTVAEYFETLGGEILSGEEHLDRLVEDVIIGAMTIESALGYLRRAPNKAVITGGDRADIALAALETSTSALILTGGLYPDVKVIARAGERGVPVLLVHYDTYTTLERCAEITRRIRPEDRRSIELAVENVEKHVDWKAVIKSLS